jgi:hypothetical protein
MSPEQDVRNVGPPERERPGAIDSDRVNPEVGSSPKSPTKAKDITAPRQCRRNAVGRRADCLACRECGVTLRAPKPIKRGLCRSCWRVAKVLVS